MRHFFSLCETAAWLFIQYRDIPDRLYSIVFGVDELKAANSNWKTNIQPFSEAKLPNPNSLTYKALSYTNQWMIEHSPFVRQASAARIVHHSANRARKNATFIPFEVVTEEVPGSRRSTSSIPNRFWKFIVLTLKAFYFEFKLLASLGKLFLPYKILVDAYLKSIAQDTAQLEDLLKYGIYFLAFEAFFAHVNLLLRHFVMKDYRYTLHHTSAKFEEILEIIAAFFLFSQIIFYNGNILSEFSAKALFIAAPITAVLAYFVGGVSLFHSRSAPKPLTHIKLIDLILHFILYLTPTFALFSVSMNAIPFFSDSDITQKDLIYYSMPATVLSLFRLGVETGLRNVDVATEHRFSVFQFSRMISSLTGGIFTFLELLPSFFTLLVLFNWECAKNAEGYPVVNIEAVSCWFILALTIPSSLAAIYNTYSDYQTAILTAARRALGLSKAQPTSTLQRIEKIYNRDDKFSLSQWYNHEMSNRLMRQRNQRLKVVTQQRNIYNIGGIRRDKVFAINTEKAVWLTDITPSEGLQKDLHTFSKTLLTWLSLSNNPAIVGLVLMNHKQTVSAHKKSGDRPVFKLTINTLLDRLRFLKQGVTTLAEMEGVYEYLSRACHDLGNSAAEGSMFLHAARTHYALIIAEMKRNDETDRQGFSKSLEDYRERYDSWSNPFKPKQQTGLLEPFESEKKDCRDATTYFREHDVWLFRREYTPYHSSSQSVNQLLMSLKNILCQFIFKALPKNNRVWHALLTTTDRSIISALRVYFIISSIRPSDRMYDPMLDMGTDATLDIDKMVENALCVIYQGVDNVNLQGFLSVFFDKHGIDKHKMLRRYSDAKNLLRGPYTSYLMQIDKFKQTFLRQLLPDFESHIANYILWDSIRYDCCHNTDFHLPSQQSVFNFLKFIFNNPRDYETVLTELTDESKYNHQLDFIQFDTTSWKFIVNSDTQPRAKDSTWIKTLIALINHIFIIQTQYKLFLKNDIEALRNLNTDPARQPTDLTPAEEAEDIIRTPALDPSAPGYKAYEDKELTAEEVIARQRLIDQHRERNRDGQRAALQAALDRGVIKAYHNDGLSTETGSYAVEAKDSRSDDSGDLNDEDVEVICKFSFVNDPAEAGAGEWESTAELRQAQTATLRELQTSFFDQAGMAGNVKPEERPVPQDLPKDFKGFVPTTHHAIVATVQQALRRLNAPRPGM